jgi:hypothetical protein
LRADSVGRWTLRIAGFTGLALFAFFFTLTFHRPQWVETFAADFIEDQLVEEIGQRIDAENPGGGVLGRLASGLEDYNEEAIRGLRSQLEARVHQYLAQALAEVRDPSCACRQVIASWLESGAATRIAQLLDENARIKSFIHTSYMKVVEDLEREIRIFTATNAAAFLLLLLVSFAKPAAARHLLFPGALLLVATLFCAWLYVFSQNWLLTIIHGDYVGWAYAGYLGVVFLFLCDIAFNRGRVTTEIGNGISEALGGAFSALTPC